MEIDYTHDRNMLTPGDKIFISFLIDLFCELCKTEMYIKRKYVAERLAVLDPYHPCNQYRAKFERFKDIFNNGKVDLIFKLDRKIINVVDDEELFDAKNRDIITVFDYEKIRKKREEVLKAARDRQNY
jgi:hypothetical protein